VLFALDEAPPDWPGHAGHIDSDLLTKYLPPPNAESLLFLCGPPMMEFKIREALLKLGYGKKQIVIP
jgi:NAD(P)H-flavin reductase